MSVHVDGARIANALARTNASPAQATWMAGVDALSFGATKGGAMAAEAVIFFDSARGANMPERRKRAGHLLSKHRFLAAHIDHAVHPGRIAPADAADASVPRNDGRTLENPMVR